jgi:hypothetical protein
MPTRSKGARLWLRRARRDRRTGESHNAVWIIRDGTIQRAQAAARMIVQELKGHSPNTLTGSTSSKRPKGRVIRLKSR